MSYGVWITVRPLLCKPFAPWDGNCGGAFAGRCGAAGFDIDRFHRARAWRCIRPLTRAIDRLAGVADDHELKFLNGFLAACRDYPTGRVTVSR